MSIIKYVMEVLLMIVTVELVKSQLNMWWKDVQRQMCDVRMSNIKYAMHVMEECLT